MIHYCDQIGILPKERPKLIFNRKELTKLVIKQRGTNVRRNGRRLVSKNALGECWTSLRLIFVTETVGGDGRVGEYVPMRQKGWKRWISRPWDYRRQKETLVHELVHYRFPSIQHGKRFKQRITEILKGQTFELQHIHLFGNYPRQYIEGIDLDPVVVVVTEEPKKEYDGRLDYFL